MLIKVSPARLAIEGRFKSKKSLLGPAERKAYDLLLDGLSTMKSHIRLRGLTRDAARRVFSLVLDDNPLVCYVDQRYVLVPEMGGTLLVPRYDFATSEACEVVSRLREAAAHLTGPLMRRTMPSVGAVLEIHDWLVSECSYLDTGSGKDHEATGPLLFRSGVCEGFARAFKVLCDACEVESLLVSGRGMQVESGLTDNHAWNMVRLPLKDGNSKWFHVDVTYDCSLTKSDPRHDYFCLSGKEISADHELGSDAAGVFCPEGLDYYKALGLFVASASELCGLVRPIARLRGGVLTVQLPALMGQGEKPAIDRVCEAAMDAYLREKENSNLSYRGCPSCSGVRMTHSFNPYRNVLHLEFDESGRGYL